MNEVFTPDGWGQVLRTESARGRTSYLVKGAGFEGWYDGLQVTADFSDHPDDIIPNENNETTLPYPSRPQGPGWDTTNSTIPPGVDPHLDMSGASDSLTGEPTNEDPVEADIEGLFEPPSRLAGVRGRRRHFAAADDPILDISALPGESPTGLENSPINPDGVDTDDLFDGDNGFERSATYDRLVIEDNLSFMRYASDDDDDDKKRERNAGQPGFPKDSDDGDGDDGDDSSSSGASSDGGGDGGHTASVAAALIATADLHFLANMCHCAETLPLHSKVEHRELLAEGGLKNRRKKNKPLGSKPLTGKHDPNHGPKTPGEAGYTGKGVTETLKKKKRGTKKLDVERPIKHADFDAPSAPGTPNDVEPQEQDLAKLWERYQQEQHTYQESNLPNLVDHSQDDKDAAGSYNHYAMARQAAPAQQDAGPTQIESQIEQLMQFWAVDGNNWWHWTGSQSDLALLNQMQQQMMAVGMPGGPPGQMQAQGSASNGFQIEANTPVPWRDYLQAVSSDRLVALAAWKDVVQKSKRLRAEGAIEVEAFRPDVITAYVQGDNGRYYTTVQRLGSVASGVGRQLTSTQVSGWSCECDWGHWSWIRKRSFVGRMCSHAYALFSEMRSLDAKERRVKGKPGRFASASNKTSWVRSDEGFEWVSNNPELPTAAVSKTASGWRANVWSDGTAEDSLFLGNFKNSGHAQRAVGRLITAHLKLAEEGDVDMVGGNDEGTFRPYSPPDSISGGGDYDPYSEDGTPEDLLSQERQEGSSGVQESTTRVGSLSVFAESSDGQDDEGPEEVDEGIEEEEPEDDDEESLDEEASEDEDSDDGTNNPGDESDDEGIEKQSFERHSEVHPPDLTLEDGPHHDNDEPCDNCGHDGGDHDSEEPHGECLYPECNCPGWDDLKHPDTDPGDMEKQSSVADLQSRYGLSHLAGANYSLSEQNRLVTEGEGKTARNRDDLNLAGTHYEAQNTSAESISAEDTLAFLF